MVAWSIPLLNDLVCLICPGELVSFITGLMWTGVLWEEGTSVEQLPRSDWLVTVSVRDCLKRLQIRQGSDPWAPSLGTWVCRCCVRKLAEHEPVSEREAWFPLQFLT